MNYGFSGASIDYNQIKSVSISYFENNAPLAQPTLSQNFTEALRNVFQNQTRLSLVRSDGDLQLTGYISDYNTTPVSITSSEIAAMNRLTISVFVKFENTKEDKKNFEQTFSKYMDYDSAKPLSEVESELIRQINELLAQEIFNKAVSDW
jgi:hypothetical protein